MHRLTPEEVRAALKSLSGWKRRGSAIERVFLWSDFAEAMRFVNRVARLAERMQHHPDILIQWNQVRLTLTTHDAQGLTAKDFELARRIEALVSGRGRTG
ncbi:MAG: 4a-hydroxytetrahydrobiopterin dehydratase [Verrucomicrobiota bacterium]|nr:4a-hydroxytetrahydrobiopterin dehydratase [Limisphaera sp.]MDW8381844.1 4a-hydroxytetrahydrobiopterin dehydratase [Verrucomicrobiota bacterium]